MSHLTKPEETSINRLSVSMLMQSLLWWGCWNGRGIVRKLFHMKLIHWLMRRPVDIIDELPIPNLSCFIDNSWKNCFFSFTSLSYFVWWYLLFKSHSLHRSTWFRFRVITAVVGRKKGLHCDTIRFSKASYRIELSSIDIFLCARQLLRCRILHGQIIDPIVIFTRLTSLVCI